MSRARPECVLPQPPMQSAAAWRLAGRRAGPRADAAFSVQRGALSSSGIGWDRGHRPGPPVPTPKHLLPPAHPDLF